MLLGRIEAVLQTSASGLDPLTVAQTSSVSPAHLHLHLHPRLILVSRVLATLQACVVDITPPRAATLGVDTKLLGLWPAARYTVHGHLLPRTGRQIGGGGRKKKRPANDINHVLRCACPRID